MKTKPKNLNQLIEEKIDKHFRYVDDSGKDHCWFCDFLLENCVCPKLSSIKQAMLEIAQATADAMEVGEKKKEGLWVDRADFYNHAVKDQQQKRKEWFGDCQTELSHPQGE